MADCALSADARPASSGNSHDISAPALSRRSLIAGGGAAIISSAVTLQPSSWFERFDAETWIERWYRAGHKLMSDPHGKLFFNQNMDADEGHAARLRAELGWPQNRHAMLGYVRRNFQPLRPGVWCGWTRRAA